jgi:hypothetical protein
MPRLQIAKKYNMFNFDLKVLRECCVVPGVKNQEEDNNTIYVQ